ncbi:hypothetical protein [Streptomyces sp. Wh19]|uniref:hypothetical protein n=1 Tax=Streptomyces sp. Wh19 TaxID=3076629 RepID=UPI0029586E93|nr:hypothetical protein [Streptomyces sp. Wh19]MDV9195874.1 hypothetical protein [Streptomyces sp. Wh19]
MGLPSPRPAARPRGEYYFCKWRDDGTDQTVHDLLCWKVREKRGRLADPSLVVLDTQSLHAAAGVPAGTTGRDAAKNGPGRNRGLAVDVLGLVIALVLLAASVHDNTFGAALLDKVAAGAVAVAVPRPWWTKGSRRPSWTTGSSWASTSKPSSATRLKRVRAQHKQWIVEQTSGILMLHRRPVRDYEHRPASAESRVYRATSDRMSKMLTGSSTPALSPALAFPLSKPLPCPPFPRPSALPRLSRRQGHSATWTQSALGNGIISQRVERTPLPHAAVSVSVGLFAVGRGGGTGESWGSW